MKMIVGSTWKANMTPYWAPSGPSTGVMIRGHTTLSPSGPKTSSIRRTRNPAGG